MTRERCRGNQPLKEIKEKTFFFFSFPTIFMNRTHIRRAAHQCLNGNVSLYMYIRAYVCVDGCGEIKRI